jgi:TRAP transporter TAXI family solute receptor
MKLKLLPHAFLVDKITAKYGPIYFKLNIPQKAYPGLAQDVPVLAVGNVLFCHERLDPLIAYQIVKNIFERKDELILVHKEAENIRLENAAEGVPMPLHPGALRYYKEKKVSK